MSETYVQKPILLDETGQAIVQAIEAQTEVIRATNATSTASAGDASTPVYFEEGMPIVCDQVATKTEVTEASSAVSSELRVHTQNNSNPHNVTAAQIGLGNVDNTADADKNVKYATSAGIATKATQDDLGNVITSTYATKDEMTAVSSAASSALATHANNKSNPHGVTKTQIGLGNVENTADANKEVKYATSAGSATKATQDASGNVITTTYATKDELDDVSSASNSALTTHTSNKSNPHGVTKAQVGLGSVDNTADANKNVKYATSAGSATKATQDASGNVIIDTYATKEEVEDVSNAASSYTDTKHGLSITGLSVNGKVITYTKGNGTIGTITTQDTNTDTKVTNTLATTTKAYVTGTTSASTNTGTQIFDTGVYLDTTAGGLVAKTFKTSTGIEIY